MSHGLPDFWQGTIAGMPAIGAGQVAWFMSDAAYVLGESHSDLINYVVPDTFELHVCSGVVSCGLPRLQKYDLRQTPAATWISPTGHSDPDGKWTYHERAYDGSLVTYAHVTVPSRTWSSYLELVINETFMDKIKFMTSSLPEYITSIDIDVYYESGWHDVYEGAFIDLQWIEKAIPVGIRIVSKARVRFYAGTDVGHVGFLTEFMFNTSGVAPQEGIYFDTQAIIPYLPQAPYIVEPRATFSVRVYNDDDAFQTMSAALAGFLQQKVM